MVFSALLMIPILLHQNAGDSGQIAPTGFPTEVSATGADDRTRTLSAENPDGGAPDLENLVPGQELVVRGSGYDSRVGIYVGFCKIPAEPGMKPGPCLGGIPDDAEAEKSENIGAEALESAWVTNNWAWRTIASHQYQNDGEFEVLLKVPAFQSEGLDCEAQACGIYTRADHTALKDRVQDLYLPFEAK